MLSNAYFLAKFRRKIAKFDGENEKNRRFNIQSRKNVGDFWLKFEFGERCKGVHCVDLGESFPTSIYL